MRLSAVPVVAAIAIVASVCACQGEPASERPAVDSERSLVGRLLLPAGDGSRGVELVATVAEAGTESRRTWILFDEQGRFEHSFRGKLERLEVSSGLRAELHRLEADQLPAADETGRVDAGAIDLRDRLTTHRLLLRAANGAPPGDVRVALCFGPPPVGPSGEPISLGSRQFPPVALGSDVDWLLPHNAESIYFLVERPVGSGREREWRGGHQRLFGPFNSIDLPAELMMD